ncbi:MAG: carotenoid biosynthesis protein [candidate division KSB1 bacterium]|nr:carotenoid biosynthesis protein [candidate division KSB1 bacterium]
MTKQKRYTWIIILAIYFLMITGGIWNILGRFQNEMRLMASPLLILLSIIVFYEYWRHSSNKLRIAIWSLAIIATGIFIEWVGVNTGWIFGEYQYGTTLKPQIGGVPIAIGFAWLNMELSSLVLAQRVTDKARWYPILTAIFMVVFDFFMESPAGQLNYWVWENGIPIQNYAAWFLIGYLLMLFGKKIKAVEANNSQIIIHVYLSQLLYFILVMLKG